MEMGKPAPRFVMNEPVAVRLLEFEYIREVLLDAIPGDREGCVLSARVFLLRCLCCACVWNNNSWDVLASFCDLDPAGRLSSS